MKIRVFSVSSLVLAGLIAAAGVHAQSAGIVSDYSSSATGLFAPAARALIGSLVRIATTLLGLITMSKVVWGWFLLQTHGGNEDRHHKATTTFTHAFVGSLLLFAAASLAPAALNLVLDVTERLVS
ncbi:MAG: hypothetical protein RLZZ324_1154 [Candidatus Parcubacteria bacterium]|jgi:hypothetical protein